jgi:hypothetical protein
MTKCEWEKIDKFSNYNEFQRFIVWIDDKVKTGVAEEVPVLAHYSGSFFKEKWFMHKNSRTVWRLVWPEVPFTGVFKLVDQSHPEK